MDRRAFLTSSAVLAVAAADVKSVGAVVPPTGARNPYLDPHRGLFCKTLRRDAQGDMPMATLRALGEALQSRDIAALEALPVENEIRLANPLAAFAFEKWSYAKQVRLPAMPPAWDSEALAEQALELYWMALLRDQALVGLERARLAEEAAAELAQTATYQGTTAKNLFRPLAFASAQHGYAISQLLWMPIPFGAHNHWQAYKMPFRGQDYLLKWEEWLRVQNGHWPAGITQHDSVLHYIRSGRDLAEFVRFDFSYQAFLNAALICLHDPHAPRTALHPRLPYKTARTQNGFATLGAAELLALVARASDMALKCAWHVKWNVSGLLRPEEYAALVERDLVPTAQRLKRSSALKRAQARWGSYLLPTSYPEGCPSHPSFPSGHATVAGACATVIKAFIDPNYEFRFPLEPTRDGRDWGQYYGPPTTAHIELEKLAINVAVGRQWAGIHWLVDSVGGLLLGEQVGLAVLAEAKAQYAETLGGWFKGFEVTTFEGKKVTI